MLSKNSVIFAELKPSEINYIAGGTCKCNCNRNTNDTEVDSYIGDAKSLAECSKICVENGWKIKTCISGVKIKKEEK